MVISVVIPTLNESSRLPALLQFLGGLGIGHEVVVCDGGSADETVAIAKSYGAKVVMSPPGRGQQLALGAKSSSGDTLLFLHADSQPHPRCLAEIERVLTTQTRVVGGNYRVEYDQDSVFCRIVEELCKLLRKFGIYYGDSGIYVRRSAYEACGGFRDMSIMEDVDFVLRLERYGKTRCLSDVPLRTSTRRFRRRTPFGLLTLWIKMHVLFVLGISDKRLAQLYDARSTESIEEKL